MLVDPECYGRVTKPGTPPRESSVTPLAHPSHTRRWGSLARSRAARYGIHPGWPILRTWPHVEESWRRIFAGPARNQFILTNEAVAVHGDTAWVTLDENLVDSGGTGPVAATNLFVLSDGRWLLVAHHGSPIIAT